MKTLSPRPQLGHIRKPQILAAAAEIIAERGIAGTRISDVAERVGASAPAVLYWFDSRDELLAESLASQEERFYERVKERVADGENAVEKLKVLVEESLSGDAPWRLWLELWSRAAHDEQTAEVRQRLDDRWRKEILAIIREGVAADVFVTAGPNQAAVTLAALIDGLAVQLTLDDPNVTPGSARKATMVAAERLLEFTWEDASIRSGRAKRPRRRTTKT